MSKKPVVLMILDGFGLNDKHEANAVFMGKTPNLDGLMEQYPFVKGYASGMAVGLPEGQMGNSEVGHLNMGAGRIVYQELTRISKEIEDGTFFENPELKKAVKNAKDNNSALHLYGLLSDGGVHSHNTHLYGLLEMAKREGLDKVFVHCFLDGRDTAPTSGITFVGALQEKMAELGVGQIASLCGRYYVMDRDNRWDRVEKAYRALTLGEGEHAEDAAAALQASYDRDITDEFVAPTVIVKDGQAIGTIQDKDSVIFFNFRPDRAREITRTFCADDFDGFDRGNRKDVTYVCFTEYDVTIPNKSVAFHKVELENTFGQYLAEHGKTQARIAETEKYAHVTFFFNGGVEEPNPGEDRILVNSPKVATYDLQPEMSAFEVCDKLCQAIRSLKYDVIIINFANPDMVGHTGIEEAAIAAVEAVDTCVGRAVEALREVDGVMFLCADHGNCEQLKDYDTGAPFTAHTTNPVPFILINADEKYELQENGCLADIVPTLIELMGMEQPQEMTGRSLLREIKPMKEGKVREVYDNGDTIIMVATDRISAFDVILKNVIVDKGSVLTQMSKFWFDFTKDIVPNHMISIDVADMPKAFRQDAYRGKSMLCKKLNMLPVECIVRGYITGSGWESYQKTGKVCGIDLPGGLQESDKLPEPIYTPTTKAEIGLHDEHITFEESVEILEKLYPQKGEEYAVQIRDCTLALYRKCADYARSKGIIIADTKFEFGLDEFGNVVLADEMLTPDSSRFWPLEGYAPGKGQPSFDKQFVRDWLKEHPDSDYLLPQDVIDRTIAKYKEAYQLLTGSRIQ